MIPSKAVPTPPVSRGKNIESDHEFTLATLRVALARAKLIVNEVTAAGVALKGGFITPATAIGLVEVAAPGLMGHLPDALRVKDAEEFKADIIKTWEGK